jgi:uncharacterized protein (DUF1501 family)
MPAANQGSVCSWNRHFNRRSILKATAVAGLGWLTPLAERLAFAEESSRVPRHAQSLIMLWLQGGPSQLETFDPHPDESIGGDTKAIKTAAEGIDLADGLPLLAEQMESISLVRSVVGKEGDHERATYNVKNGYRPDPTLVHPSLGAIMCHKLSDKVEIPRHVSIIPSQWPARGGYLGADYDAFKTFDPVGQIPDVTPRVSAQRADARLDDLQKVVEARFARGRLKDLDKKTLHSSSIAAARRMMSSEQLKAFDVSSAPQSLRDEFGNTPFGRSCLAAIQLIEVGVRCVEVTLDGWDTHADNHGLCKGQNAILDPAFASLVKHLKQRGLLEKTVVVCAGEFGRTPKINPLGGRDHWPHGFSIALAGGGIQGGRVIGETSPKPKLDEKDRLADVADARNVEDIHATILQAVGIDHTEEVETPIGRPMALSKGTAIEELFA